MSCRDVEVLYGTTTKTEHLLAVLIGERAARSVVEWWGERPLRDIIHHGNGLASLPGMTSRRAAQVIAAVRLGRRDVLEARAVCTSSADAYYLLQDMRELQHEECRAILLDARCRVIDIVLVARGGTSSCHVEVPSMFRAAITAGAASIVLAHNHPSGVPDPSDVDYRLTDTAVAAGKMLGISVVDHVVVAAGGFARAVRP